MKDIISIDNYAHVFNRGAKRLPIVKDENDKWRFLKTLFYFNSENTPQFWDRDIFLRQAKNFEWLSDWPKRKPIVKILAFCLMPNHFHLLLKPSRENAISDFMRKVSNSYTGYFNKKYGESGHLFQGRYQAKRLVTDDQFKYLGVYIQVKNPFELVPGGFEKAIKNFSASYEWATNYHFCSLGNMAGKRNSPIVDKDLLGEIFTPINFEKFAKDCMDDFDWAEEIAEVAIDTKINTVSV